VVVKFHFCIFSILMLGKEAVCLDGLFVPAVFREVHFYLKRVLNAAFEIVTPSNNDAAAPVYAVNKNV
jgi:hypothetical protein